MIVLKILDVKNTMSHLLVKNSFDYYLLEEAEVTTYATMKLDGRRNRDWYDEEEEKKNLPRLLYWKEVKGVFYDYIKGKRTPENFRITLKITSKTGKDIFREESMLSMMEKYGVEFLLHFRYEQDGLNLITGISYNQFTMDKKMEFVWDDLVKKLFRQLCIGWEEQ